LEFPTNLPVAL